MRNLVSTILVAALVAVAGCAAPAADSGARSYEPNTMHVVVGASIDRPESGVGVGATYEHRKEDKLGYGGFADVAFADKVTTAFGGAVYWHPADRWTVFGGPGVLLGDGDADVFARIGGSYTFPVKEWTMAPIAWIDLGEDVAFFVGVALVLNF